jgi:uncharacterized protein (DUF1800 family)
LDEGKFVIDYAMALFPLRRDAGVLAAVLLLGTVACAQETPTDHAEVVHVLNRITFGPRPGDVETVEKMGVRKYIEQQLHPELIDDSAVDQEVAQFELLQMSAPELTQLYYEDLKRGLKKQKELAAAQGGQSPAMTSGQMAPGQTQVVSYQAPVGGQFAPGQFGGQAPAGQAPEGLAKRIEEASKWRSVAAVGQLEQAKLVRAVDSQRQLQEVLVDFWSNHFNIDVKKGPCRVLAITEDRDVIRPHIWGRFRDLLEATAKSPAMLHYLDNATNTVEKTMSPMEQEMRARFMQALTGQSAPPGETQNPDEPMRPKKVGGINENYGREVMELHTIGVDAGYTQKDVQEVARCFTGWTYDKLTGEFLFRERLHDNGPKTVLGHEIPADGGMQDGETVLDILASSPACAHFISRELCQRFVSDDPPEALVERIAGVFTQTQGDLREVTEAILLSPEFLSPQSFGNKIKSPLEFAVSAVRASDSTLLAKQSPPWDKLLPTIEGAGVMGKAKESDRLSHFTRQSLNWHVYELGEPLYACTPPTGYTENSKNWVSPGALIERLNFALALTQQQVSDVRFGAQKILAGIDLDHPEKILDQCIAVLLQDNITDATRKVLTASAVPAPGTSQTVNPNKLIALILGSPEFQRK